MCGISAICSPIQEDHNLLVPMTRMLHHRGPDGEGFFSRGGVSLGHKRLAILDLSNRGAQPMHSHDNLLHLVCNGEVYNFQEKNAVLCAKGYKIISSSDSETLLHLYEEYGLSFLKHINGMFAFVIFDEKSRRLVAAVDRFGKKPLYYALHDGRLALSSELKSLLLLPWVSRKINPIAIDRYLMLRYVPAPHTMFTDVNKVEPATMLTWEAGNLTLSKYWSPSFNEELPYTSKTCEAFDELLDDAVNIRLQSDVPLGIYLSGGVDSAAIAGIMNKLAPEGKRIAYTVSIQYKHDELHRAKQIADYLNYELNPVKVDPEDFDLAETIMWHLDEPFGDAVCIPSFLLAKKAKEQLTVTLTGDGADEIFNGYFHQRVMAKWYTYRKLFCTPGANVLFSSIVKHVPLRLLNKYFDYPDVLGLREMHKLYTTLSECNLFGKFYEGITACFTSFDKAILYTHDFKNATTGYPISDEIQEVFTSSSEFPILSRLSLLDIRFWLPYSLIFRLDKLNMAHAVETRSPFLDYRIVQMALNLCNKAKLDRGYNKIILRDRIAKLYPPALREKGKQAFYMPITDQYKNRFLKWAKGLLTEEATRKRGFFRWEYISDLLVATDNYSMLVNRQITALAMLELWFRVFAPDSFAQ